MIKVAVVGATGYAGEELLKVLVNHPQVKIISVSAKIDKPQNIGEIFPYLSGKLDLVCREPEFARIVPDCDVAFLALPHRVSMEVAPAFLQGGKKVIDLSADYRLQNASVYKKYYGVPHKNPEYLKLAVYGLPEACKEDIKKAKLLANPGCYPTGIILGCLPALAKGLAKKKNIIADAKTGLSGAGREKEAQLIPQMKENFCAYKVDAHQHGPEINQELSQVTGKKIDVTFTPHLLPVKRGILSTIYMPLKKAVSQKKMQKAYQNFYKNAPFVKILPEGQFPQLKDVVETNYCHIGIKVNPDKKLAIIITALDNLVKGASGQAVQNMNIMYGFDETEGLKSGGLTSGGLK